MKLLIINGPNLNLLGLREPEIYGKQDYAALLDFLQTSAEEAGVEIECFQSNHEGAIVDAIQAAYGVFDGIIINHAGSPETEKELVQSDIPLAVIGIRNPKLLARTQSIAFIRNDNIETGRVAARYFRSLGNFRSFGYIPASQTGEEWSLSRAEGFRAELAAAEAEVSVFTCAANVGTEVSRRELAVWLKALPKPAAVLAAWDYPAIQALEICRAEAIKVPHDIAALRAALGLPPVVVQDSLF